MKIDFLFSQLYFQARWPAPIDLQNSVRVVGSLINEHKLKYIFRKNIFILINFYGKLLSCIVGSWGIVHLGGLVTVGPTKHESVLFTNRFIDIQIKNIWLLGNPAAEGTGYVFMKFLSRILFYFILHVLVCRVINENVFKSSANIQCLVLKQHLYPPSVYLI